MPSCAATSIASGWRDDVGVRCEPGWRRGRAAASGAGVADIAQAVHLSENTVRNYLSAGIAKTGTRNRMEAVLVAQGKGWL